MERSQAKKHDNTMTNKILMRLIALVVGLLFLEILIIHSKNEQQKSVSNQVQTARIMANGDLLYHDGLYMRVPCRQMVVMILLKILHM